MTAAPRHRRPARPVDVTAFTGQVDAALAAFAQDVSYAVIANKRAMWAARAELRAAESRAHVLCAATDAFECHATAACGTGDCKFAAGEHAQLVTRAAAGTTRRPQASSTGPYSLDTAVAALAAHRRRSPGGGTAPTGHAS
jgi:Tfp pilus assembly protein PilX